MKVELVSPSATASVGSALAVGVTLRDTGGNLVRSESSIEVNLTLTLASGRVLEQPVQIQKGETTGISRVTIPETGIVRIRAVSRTAQLLDDAGVIVVKGPAGSAAPGAAVHAETGQHPVGTKPSLLMQVSAREHSGLVGDGTDAATISFFYMDRNGTAAPTDIHIFLHWDCGDVSGQPVLHKGADHTDVKWTARGACDGKVRIERVAPFVPIAGPLDAQVRFVRAVDLEPSAPEVISTIDQPDLVIRVVDRTTRTTVASDIVRKLLISSLSGNLEIQPPTEKALAVGDFATVAKITPRSFFAGGEIRVSMAGVSPKTIAIKVQSFGFLAMTLLFGFAGSAIRLLDKKKYGGKIIVRTLLLGEASALVLVLSYIAGAVRNLDGQVVHSIVSVPVVAFVGSLLGRKGLETIGVRFFGWMAPISDDERAESEPESETTKSPVENKSTSMVQNSTLTVKLDEIDKRLDSILSEWADVGLPLSPFRIIQGSATAKVEVSPETAVEFQIADDTTMQSLLPFAGELDPQRLASVLVKLARYWKFTRDYQNAVDRLDRAIDFNNQNAVAFELLGEVLALQAVETTLPPGDRAALLERSRRRLERSLQLQETTKDPGGGAKKDQVAAETLHALAWTLDSEMQYEKAIYYYRRSLSADSREGQPNREDYSYNLACSLSKAGLFEQCLAELTKLFRRGDWFILAGADSDFDGLRTSQIYSNQYKDLIARARESRGLTSS